MEQKNNEKNPNRGPVAFLGVVAIVIAVYLIQADPGTAAFWIWIYAPFQSGPSFGVIVRVVFEYLLLAIGFTCLLASMFSKRLNFKVIVQTALEALFCKGV